MIREAANGDASPKANRASQPPSTQVYDYLTRTWPTRSARASPTWLLDEVTMVRVRVSEYSVAYKVFQSLNHRGKPLSDHDILKSALFERAGFSVEEAREQSERWNTYTSRLGDRGFGDMLKQVRSIYDRESAGDMVTDLIAAIIPRGGFRAFLNEQLPRFVNAYDAVVNGNTDGNNVGPEALRRIVYLRSIHHESWRAPAIAFLVDHAQNSEQADRFFWALDRLAYTLQYSVKDREYRHKRYRRVLDAMDKPGVLFDADSPLDLTGREKSDLDRAPARPLPQLQAAPRPADARSLAAARTASPARSASHRLHGRAHPSAHAIQRGSDWYEEWSQGARPRGADRMHRQLHAADPRRKPGS
jgi:hypothetical protein